jgi:hypothetical protein
MLLNTPKQSHTIPAQNITTNVSQTVMATPPANPPVDQTTPVELAPLRFTT